MIPRDEPNFTTTKQETSTSTTTTTTATTWSRSKDPRIVRVSRALGSKDRHSKVCTVRGLRDRRVRLSVPTAIQLYDLQDRLGLSQPSKVVDWLLNAAKHEIDELPPLQFPHEDSLINPNFHPMMSSFRNFTNSQSAKHGLKSKGNHVSGETSVGNETGWVRDEDEARFNLHNQGEMNNFLDRQNIFSSIPNYNSFLRSSWDHDPSSLTLNHHHDHHDHQPSISLGLTAHQNHDLHNFSFLQSGPSGLVSNQVLVYNQPGISTPTQPYFPQTNTGFDTKALNNFQTSSEMSNPVRPFEFSATANLLPWQNNNAASEENN